MSKISHSFSVQVACTMDIPRAIILQHLIFLQDSSESGWAKKSNESMRTTYPYLTPKAIRTALEKLEKGCYLISEIKNAFKSDRTKSYYVTPEGRAVYDLPPFAEKANAFAEKGTSDVPKRANQMCRKGQMNNIGSYSIIPIVIDAARAENSAPLETEIPNGNAGSAAPAQRFFEDWLSAIDTDFRIAEGFTITQKIPQSFFSDFSARFKALARTQPDKYQRRYDVTGHFLNWSRIQYQEAQKNQGPFSGHTNVPRYGSR